MSSIKLLIADDHEVVRSGLKTLIEGTEIEIIGEVGTGEAAVKFAMENDPDVVLLDIRMPSRPTTMCAHTWCPPLCG